MKIINIMIINVRTICRRKFGSDWTQIIRFNVASRYVKQRYICPYHSWVISENDIKIDVSRYCPAIKLITKDIYYFDGTYNSIFRISGGLGNKLFSAPEFNDAAMFDELQNLKIVQ
jgi:hypothetical protein